MHYSMRFDLHHIMITEVIICHKICLWSIPPPVFIFFFLFFWHVRIATLKSFDWWSISSHSPSLRNSYIVLYTTSFCPSKGHFPKQSLHSSILLHLHRCCCIICAIEMTITIKIVHAPVTISTYCSFQWVERRDSGRLSTFNSPHLAQTENLATEDIMYSNGYSTSAQLYINLYINLSDRPSCPLELHRHNRPPPPPRLHKFRTSNSVTAV